MANWKKIGIISGIGAGLVGIATYASRLNKASNNLETVVKANLHSIKLEGITIRIDVKIKNPSSVGFKINYPFVKVIYKRIIYFKSYRAWVFNLYIYSKFYPL